MTAKLHVSNLPIEATEQAIRERFSKAGTVVSVVIVNDLMSGRSKGIAFVKMATPGEAKTAISLLNGCDFQGQRLTVREALRDEAPVPFHNRSRPNPRRPI